MDMTDDSQETSLMDAKIKSRNDHKFGGLGSSWSLVGDKLKENYNKAEGKLNIDLLPYTSGNRHNHLFQQRPKSVIGLTPYSRSKGKLLKTQECKVMKDQHTPSQHYLEQVLCEDMTDPKEADLAKFSIIEEPPTRKRKDSFSSWENANPIPEMALYSSTKLKTRTASGLNINKNDSNNSSILKIAKDGKKNVNSTKNLNNVCKLKSNISTIIPKNYEKDIENHKNKFKIMNFTFRERFLTPSLQSSSYDSSFI